jgi:lantibiotic modifying enzyme
VIYAATKCGGWLGDAHLLDAATALALDAGRDAHPPASRCDLHGGCAGLLLGILALEAMRPSVGLLERAEMLGAHLLEARERDVATGRFVWTNEGEAPSTGFAHGSSGIAVALGRLYRRTGARHFRSAVVEAIAFEDALFVPGTSNWLESSVQLRHDGRDAELWSTWCHGATGIGLSRLSLRRDRIGRAFAADVAAAIQTTAQQPPGGPDHLCCGTFGRVDLLLAAGRTGDGRRTAAAALVAAHARGSFNLALDDRYAPGLMQGTSGIGLTLLRLARPRQFSPTLLFT